MYQEATFVYRYRTLSEKLAIPCRMFWGNMVEDIFIALYGYNFWIKGTQCYFWGIFMFLGIFSIFLGFYGIFGIFEEITCFLLVFR